MNDNGKKNSVMIDVKTSQSFQVSEVINVNNNDEDYFIQEGENEFAGRHYIVDFWNATLLQDIRLVEQALKDAAEVAGAVLLHIHLHRFSSGGGITGVALLAESHISVHTWPERGYAAFDVFMCGHAKPDKAVELLQQVFKPQRTHVELLLRGKQRLVQQVD